MSYHHLKDALADNVVLWDRHGVISFGEDGYAVLYILDIDGYRGRACPTVHCVVPGQNQEVVHPLCLVIQGLNRSYCPCVTVDWKPTNTFQILGKENQYWGHDKKNLNNKYVAEWVRACHRKDFIT